MPTFYLPERPYGPIAALNRRAAAVGSPGYAQKTEHADYNGHRVGISWNDYRGYYITEYSWAGRQVLARSTDFAACLRAAISEYERGALGSMVVACPRPGDEVAIEACKAAGMTEGNEHDRSWWTWRHDVATQSVRDYCFPRALAPRFDWDLLQAAHDRKAYDALLVEKYGSAWA